MGDQRGPWYLLTGLVIGLALGLAYAWWINPVAYVNTAPGSLRQDYKSVYRNLIGAAYSANGNLERARVRLALLQDPDPAAALAAQAQLILAQGGSQEDARRLALLAAALGKSPQPTAAVPSLTSTMVPTRSAPTLTATVTATVTASPAANRTQLTSPRAPTATHSVTPTLATPLPTLTPTATLGAPFILKDRLLVCDPSLPEALLQVQVTDASGNPIPGVEIRVTWQNGEDRFFTGLKPEISPGYADFVMTVGEVYSVRLAEGSQAASNLSVPSCGRPGETNYSGGWLLNFTQ